MRCPSSRVKNNFAAMQRRTPSAEFKPARQLPCAGSIRGGGMMGVAEAIGLDPVKVLVQALVETLHERAQGVAWRSTPEGLVADIAEGELLLSPVPGPTAVW